jgi:hypothetical protein
MEVNTYQNIWASMLAICKRFAETYPEYELTVVDFDENVSESEYPAGNLIGVYQMEYSEDDTLMYGRLMFPMSFNDTFMAVEAVGRFANFIKAQKSHPYILYSTSQQIGRLVALNELNISPTIKTTNRQFRFILQGFAVDRSASFLPS